MYGVGKSRGKSWRRRMFWNDFSFYFDKVNYKWTQWKVEPELTFDKHCGSTVPWAVSCWQK